MFEKHRATRRIKKDRKTQIRKENKHVKRLERIIKGKDDQIKVLKDALNSNEERFDNNMAIGEEIEQFFKSDAMIAGGRWKRAQRWSDALTGNARVSREKILELSDKGIL